jgi:hypothetical protein
MLQELTASVRRWAGMPLTNKTPLVRLGDKPLNAVVVAQTDIESLRGVTPSAADQMACACPDSCERDHANE